MIHLDGVTKEFKKVIKRPGLAGSVHSLFHREYETVKAVDNISFDVPAGEILGFIGANGAGKSTTIKMLTGILTPTAGTVEIDGKIPWENRTQYVKEIGVVFGQRTQLWWDLPLTETFSVLKQIYQVDDEKFKKRMGFLNEVLELDGFIKSPVRTLSLGQRMRADLAASMIHNPKVLFLDEPTIGLDVAVKNNIRHAITQINEEEGTTIVLTTHDLNDIETLCKRIIIIDRGSIMYDGDLLQMKKEYGRFRQINLSLHNSADFAKLQFGEAVQVERSKEKITVTFDSEAIAVSDMLSAILASAPVKDISVSNVNIEQIVGRMYANGVSAK